MDNAASRPRPTVVPGESDTCLSTLHCRPAQRSVGRSREKSDGSSETVLLRKQVRRGQVRAGWICAVRTLGVSLRSGTGAGRWPEIREGCRERPGKGPCTRMARHSIGDAMNKLLATDHLLSRQRSLWGASLLLLPSSAGDNRPYISNLARKRAGAHLCSDIRGHASLAVAVHEYALPTKLLIAGAANGGDS